MLFDDFIAQMIKQGGVDKDGAYGKQCMDLYNQYCVDVGELENGKTGASCAKEILNNSYVMSNVDRIDNYLEFTPQKGDIAVFTGGKYGHVAICLGENDGIKTFRSLDQNWVNQQLTLEWHNYTYMSPIVFLRFKNRKNIENTFWCRVDKKEAAVRSEPHTSANLNGSKILNKGDTFECTGTVTGENVNNNNIWYKSKKGNYVWSGGITRL